MRLPTSPLSLLLLGRRGAAECRRFYPSGRDGFRGEVACGSIRPAGSNREAATHNRSASGQYQSGRYRVTPPCSIPAHTERQPHVRVQAQSLVQDKEVVLASLTTVTFEPIDVKCGMLNPGNCTSPFRNLVASVSSTHSPTFLKQSLRTTSLYAYTTACTAFRTRAARSKSRHWPATYTYV